MSDLISAFAHHLTRRSTRTARTYEAVARTALRFFRMQGNLNPVGRADVEAFLGRAGRGGKRRAAATSNQELAALRALASFAVENGYWATNPTAGIAFAREAPRDPAVLTVAELRRFFIVAAQEAEPWRRARSLAILALLSQGGLRVHELVALDIEQVDVASATLVAVRGKGGTLHDVPMNSPTLALMGAWTAARRRFAEDSTSALFVSQRGGRISIRSVQRLLASLRAAVGTKKHVTPHTLRHTTATLALSMGSDLSTVGDLLRHCDLNTTRRYLHLVDERRREAVNRLAAAIPESIVSCATAPNGKRVASCAEGSSKSAASRDADVDAQYGLDDVAEAA